MSRWCCAGPLVVLAACRCDGAADARAGLRVPLPDGWHATHSDGALLVGPGDRVVLQLEPQPWALPQLEQLMGPLQREKVTISTKESTSSFVGVTYRFTPSAEEGFLGVQRTAGRTVWCATTHDVKADELAVAVQVCRGVSEERSR